MRDKYILDSNLWIEIERNNSCVAERVVPLIEKNKVCLVDVIIAEVLRGVKSKEGYRKLLQSFKVFNIYSTSWLVVSELAFKVARRGHNPPLVDLYIAQVAIENKKTLLTQDKHFVGIKEVQNFSLELI